MVNAVLLRIRIKIIIDNFFLGRVQSGMLTVKRIGQVETDNHDRPVDDVKIVKSGIMDWSSFSNKNFLKIGTMVLFSKWNYAKI